VRTDSTPPLPDHRLARRRPPPSAQPRTPPISRGIDGRRALGRLGEELAAGHFTGLGFSVLARNVRTRHGEIDLIAFDGHAIVFAEVKTRRVSAQRQSIRPDQEPLMWLQPRQRARLRRLAAAWLHDKTQIRPAADTIRFDAVGVVLDTRDELVRLDHIEGAW
jgi:putative endonuclease